MRAKQHFFLGAAVKGRGEPSDDNCSAALDMKGKEKKKDCPCSTGWQPSKYI